MNPEQEYREGLRKIIEEDGRYPEAAYMFVRAAVNYTAERLKQEEPERTERHISGGQLLEGIRELAVEQFGPLTLDVLHEWGVRRTEDFGNIVFNLVNAALLGANDEDSPADFAGGYDFNEVFLKPFVELEELPSSLPRIDDF
jgi:uncharacterized repeat protein (TIGR04138 family)